MKKPVPILLKCVNGCTIIFTINLTSPKKNLTYAAGKSTTANVYAAIVFAVKYRIQVLVLQKQAVIVNHYPVNSGYVPPRSRALRQQKKAVGFLPNAVFIITGA